LINLALKGSSCGVGCTSLSSSNLISLNQWQMVAFTVNYLGNNQA
jgi:hypothetical protein